MREAQAPTIYLKDYQPPAFLIDSVDLDFDLRDDYTQVTGRLAMRRNPAYPAGKEALVLDGQEMDLQSVSLNGQELPVDCWQVDADQLTVHEVPERFTLEVVTRIDPAANTALEGLYFSDGMYCTQCEAEGFRKIMYYLDRPDVMARFTTRIEGDKARFPVLLSNGNCVEAGDLADGRHFARWEDPFLKPAYLFALVAGDLHDVRDSYTTASGREVDLRIYVEKENLDKCDHAMASLKNAMAWDEREYGREYDLDIYMIVAVNSFNMGAMENKGLNVFNSKYVLARPDTATDRDFQGIEGVIAHEYFHNWTGNRITCRDWFQLSLKEGLTVFRDQEFSADMGSRGVKRIDDVRILRAHQFPEDAGPMAHPVRPDSYMEINNFYTVTVYNKGAEVVRMQRNLLGAEDYRKATDLYFERHDGQAVTTDDFVTCMEDASGKDLSQFRRWYSQAGTPVVSVKSEYDAAAQRLTLNVHQSCPATPKQPSKEPFHIPLAMGLVGPDGADLPLQLDGEAEPVGENRVLDITEADSSFTFLNVPADTRPSLLRGFSAPVKLEYDYSQADLAFLMAHDSDDFNRWDASQRLALAVIKDMIEQRNRGEHMSVPDSYLDAFGIALKDEESDPDLVAQVLSLPGIAYVGEFMQTIDVDGIHQARENIRVAIAGRFGDTLAARYESLSDAGDFEISAEAIGRRSLRNGMLAYLVANKDSTGLDLLLKQFDTANNMTDSLAALAHLAEFDDPRAAKAVDAFYDRWQNDTLVLDKWFAVQASADRPDALERVRGLLDHPAFSIKNPNKVRAVIGSFAGMNPVHFHAVDGSGYRFLADRIIELDALNPQVASRMTGPFTRYLRYDDVRKGLMRSELQRIHAREGLSRDVMEVVSKSLEA